jgi:tRNA-(ms[2]io[6]A)-hydroxylase
MSATQIPASIDDLLQCPTPEAWLEAAVQQQDILLIDHANCEKKAASTALSLMYRYVDKSDLLNKLSRLAREELRHFEQVFSIMQKREVEYVHIAPSRYAAGLHKHMRKQEPLRLLDTLIIGGIIEARSCERFRALAPLLDADLCKFYQGLLASEERHFRDYFFLAQSYFDDDFTDRIHELTAIEAQLIEGVDEQFRFHSGMPL